MAISSTFPLLTDDELRPLISRAIAMVCGEDDAVEEGDAGIVLLLQDEQAVISRMRSPVGSPPVAQAYIHRRLGLIRTTPFTGLIEDED